MSFKNDLLCSFQLEESSVFRHEGERKIRVAEEDEMSVADSIATEVTMETISDHEQDISDDEDDDGQANKDIDGGVADNGNAAENCDIKLQKDHTDENTDKTKIDMCTCDSAENSESQKTETSESAVLSDVDIKIEIDEKRTISENQIDKQSESAKNNQNEEKVVEFPDTEISLQHVKGDK